MKHYSSWNVFLSSISKKRTARIAKRNLPSRLLRLESLEERQLLSVTTVEYDQIRNEYPTFQLSDKIIDNNIIELDSLSATNLQNAINQATQTDFDDLIVIRNFNDSTFKNDFITIDLDDGSHGKLSIVGFDENGNLATFDDIIGSHQYTVKGSGFFNGHTWFAPMKDSVLDTANDFSPQTVESNSLIRLDELRNDSRFSFARGTNYTTVIIDTGINETHNYFKDSEGNSRIVYQYDFVYNNANATDVHGHGTHVAGIAAGTVGVASDANIIALKVSLGSGGSMPDYAILNALKWVVANQELYNITSVNMSLGSANENYNVYTAGSYHDALTSLNEMGVIVCVAAGNFFYEHNSEEGLSYPAAEESVVSVGAVFDANMEPAIGSGASAFSTAPDQIACFTQRSSTLLSIMAPGSVLTSAGIDSDTATRSTSGTSQASPVVAGVAILAQEIANKYLGRSLTVSEFKTLIKETGKDIYDGTYDDGAIEDDNVTNTEKWYKRIDVYALAEAIYEMGGIVVDSLEDTVDATDGKTTLREAIANAQTGDIIVFAKNLNGQTITLSGTELEITKEITISAAHSNGITIDANNQSRVFNISGGSESSPVKLIGLIISGGISDNGGGVYLNDGTLLMANCTVTGNSAVYGGGIYNNNNLTITNCTISGNAATTGAGIYNNLTGILTMEDCTLSENTASSYGGGIYNYSSGTVTLNNCSVSDNSASQGSGVYNTGSLTLAVSKVCANTASSGGGIFNSSSGSLTLTNCFVYGNNAEEGGGVVNNGTAIMTNCTVSRNSATGSSSAGGGIINSSGTLTLYNSIVIGNTSNGSDNDIYRINDALSAYNTLSNYTSWDTGSDNLIYDSSLPLFTNAANGDYSLAENSQAIDKGNNAYAVDAQGNPILYDFAGNSRISHNIIDIGAYEYQVKLDTPVITAGTITSDTIEIVWNSIPNALGYVIEYKKDNENNYTVLTGISSSATSNTITGLVSNTTYNIRIYAVCSGNYINSEYSSVITVVTLQEPEDSYEPNDTINTATDLGILTSIWSQDLYAGINENEDWFKFTTTGTGTANHYIRVTYEHNGDMGVDVDFALYNTSGNLIERTYGVTGTEEISLNNLAPGSYYIQVYNYYNITHSVPYTLTVNPPTTVDKPDLKPFTPDNWSGSIIVATSNNAITSSLSITTEDDIYINFASINSGYVNITNTFYSEISISGTSLAKNYYSDGLNAGYYNFLTNMWNIGKLSKGTYTVTIKLDVTEVVDESDETNNTFTYSFTVTDNDTKTVVVDSLEDTINANDGKTTLREALASTKNGDTIIFDSSLSGGTITLSGTQLAITKDITIDASALLNGITINANGRSRVFDISGGSELLPVNLIGITIYGGYLSNNEGGGIHNSGILTLTNCTVSGNSSSGNGAGIDSSGNLTLTNCTVSGNSSSGNGGGIGTSGMLTLTNCTVSGNSASYGGGILNAESTVILNNCIISDNTAVNPGGGIYNGGILTVTNSTISGNSASYGGGIINVENTTVSLNNCIFSDNIAVYSGGGVYSGGLLTVTNSTFTGNSANLGGAMINFGTSTLTNSLLFANSAYYGGSISNGATLTLTNCTVTGCSADYGGGIYNDSSLNTLWLYNSIIACNTATQSNNDIQNDSGFINAYNTLSSYNNWNTSDSSYLYDSSKPLFNDEANNDYKLAVNSQAIDKGNNAYVVDAQGNPILFDLLNMSRIYYVSVDLGAYEYQLPNAPSDVRFGTYDPDTRSVDLFWTDNADNEDGFRVEYSTNGTTWILSQFMPENTEYRLCSNMRTDTIYQYRIRTYNIYGSSDWIYGSVSTQILPNAPSDVRFEEYNPSAKTVKMLWNDNSSNEKGFRIEYSTDNGTTWKFSQVKNANETSRTCTGLMANKEYMFRVRAYNDSGSSDWAVGSFSTRIAPAAPSGVTFDNYNAINKTVIMSWIDNANNENGFRIEYSIDNGATWRFSQVMNANETSRTCTGLTPNKDYMFRVRAYNDSGSSDWAVGSFSTKVAPIAPSNVRFDEYNPTAKTVKMSWDDNSSNEKGFRIEYSMDNGATWKFSQFKTANETSRTCTGLTSNKDYMFRVRAYNDSGSSDWAVGSFSTKVAPAAPSEIQFDSYNPIDKTVTMSWTDNSDNEKGFRVEYSMDNGTTWRLSQLMNANSTNRTCSGIKANTTYMFRVRAYNDSGSSDWAVATFVPNTTSAIQSMRLFDSIFEEEEDWI